MKKDTETNSNKIISDYLNSITNEEGFKRVCELADAGCLL